MKFYNLVTGLPLTLIRITKATTQLGISQVCAQCRSPGEIGSLCVCPGCNGRAFHKRCWSDVIAHQPGEGLEICKPPIDFTEYVWVKWLLYSKTSPEQQALLHKDDVWSTWFGVPHRLENFAFPELYIYPRLQYLITQAQNLRGDGVNLNQYPSLVSFFGDTGGGKSTLIKALIYNASLDTTEQVPVPGNNADRHKSTSGDIHLYCDPRTIDSKVPIFYTGQFPVRGCQRRLLANNIRLRGASRQRDISSHKSRHRRCPIEH